MANANSDYMTWICCLYSFFVKMHKSGILGVESDLETPRNDESVFSKYPVTLNQPVLEFATDLLRLAVDIKVEPGDIKFYAETYLAHKTDLADAPVISLLHTIWLTVWAYSKFDNPRVACEFGRQAIPEKYRPTSKELYELLVEKNEQTFPANSSNGYIARLEKQAADYVASLVK